MQVRKTIRPTKLRPSLTPGTILIVLAGRFRGKRVVLLRHLSQGVLLVTGPFKVNGVPLRRVNARYVIATSSKVDLSGVDDGTVDKVAKEGYFAREKSTKGKKGEEEFFAQGEKPEVQILFLATWWSNDTETNDRRNGLRALVRQTRRPSTKR